MGLSLPEPSDDGDDDGGLVAPGFETIEIELDLGDTVMIKDIWVDGAGLPESAGLSSFLFPSGGAESLYSFRGREWRRITLRVHPLNGKAEILPGYVEAPKECSCWLLATRSSHCLAILGMSLGFYCSHKHRVWMPQAGRGYNIASSLMRSKLVY